MMLLPAITGTGVAEFVTDISAESATIMVLDAVLLAQLGSLAAQVTEAVCVILVPEATFVFTLVTKVKLAVVLAASVPIVQVSVPRLQVQPAGPVKDWGVVFTGADSVKVRAPELAGPLFATVWV